MRLKTSSPLSVYLSEEEKMENINRIIFLSKSGVAPITSEILQEKLAEYTSNIGFMVTGICRLMEKILLILV